MSKQEKKGTLSAHELNKYAYCPYQWYFEKTYGRKELRRLYVERNEKLGLEDSIGSHFRRGEAFHEGNYRAYSLRRRMRRILTAAVVCVLLLCALAVKYDWI